MIRRASARLVAMWLVVALFVVLVNGRPAVAQYDDLLKFVPGDANSIVYIDCEAVNNSKAAAENDWVRKHEESFAEGVVYLPPTATQFVLAAEFDLQTGAANWELALAKMPDPPSLEDVAAREKGYVDDIGGKKVAWTPRGAFIGRPADDIVALLHPANRQLLARWIQRKGTSSFAPSDYLQKASHSFDVIEGKPQVVMAIDASDLIQPHVVKERLSRSPAVKEKRADVDRLTRMLSGIQGVTFQLWLDKKSPEGRLTVDFSEKVEDSATMSGLFKPLVVEALQRHGMAVDELENWTTRLSGTTASLEGNIGKSGLMRVFSLIELPSVDLYKSGMTEPTQPMVNPMIQATKDHFRSVQELLQDLKQDRRDSVAMTQVAKYMEMYARRIDRLPILNVDPEMQDYSAEVANLMRKAGQGWTNYGITSVAREQQIYAEGQPGSVTYGYDYGHGPYGTYTYDGWRNLQGERRAVNAQERYKAATNSTEIFGAIDQITGEIRRAMTNKYQVEF